jgi:hypothetical protein
MEHSTSSGKISQTIQATDQHMAHENRPLHPETVLGNEFPGTRSITLSPISAEFACSLSSRNTGVDLERYFAGAIARLVTNATDQGMNLVRYFRKGRAWYMPSEYPGYARKALGGGQVIELYLTRVEDVREVQLQSRCYG